MPSNTKKTSTKAKLPKNKQSYGQGWAKKSSDVLRDITCPSGATCQVRIVGLNGLIKAGILESLDSLTSIVASEVIPRAEGTLPTEVTPEDILKNPAQLNDMIALMDKIALYAVVQPKLSPVPQVKGKDEKLHDVPIEDRILIVTDSEGVPVLDEDGDEQPLVYVDQVDLLDKTHIMQQVMGASSELVDFRP